jgi:hypothetical protein
MGWTDGALMIAVTQDVSVQAICTRAVTNRTATNGEKEDVLYTEKLCGSCI